MSEFGLPPEWRALSPEAKKVLLHKLRGMHISKGLGGPRPWRELARPKQLPPDDPRHHLPDDNGFACGCAGLDENWRITLFMAGRGCGKTWAGANWVIEQALRDPGSMWAVIAPTFRDVRVTCFEGPSGIRRQLAPGEEDQWRRNELRLDLVNGSVIYGYSADQPERLRGSNLSGAWVDELCSWQYEEAWTEGLIPALRIGSHPRVYVTTTPRPTKLIRDLFSRRDGSVHVIRSSTWENAANLSAVALDELRRRYEGTRLGRQELEGELLDDLEGALWRRSDIDAARIKPADIPQLIRIVVAIDPAMTSGEDSDETGIVVAGEDGHGHGYVLADLSMRGSPEQCMRKAVEAYRHWQADCIVAEVNNGGDFVGTVIRTVDANIPYRQVRASRGKAIRAEPVSTIYEQHRVHHVGSFPDLEDQMCTFAPGVPGPSPDRMDALVWAMYELKSLSHVSWLSAYGARKCAQCEFAYTETAAKCPRCGHEPDRREIVPEIDDRPDEPVAGSWAAVYQLRRCERGHSYSGRASACPRCHSGALGYLRKNGRTVGQGSMLTS